MPPQTPLPRPPLTLSATGNKNSMKGTTKKTATGTRRNTSATVRVSWRRSRRVSARPDAAVRTRRPAMRTSAPNSFRPAQ